MRHHIGARIWIVSAGTSGETYVIVGVDGIGKTYSLKGENSNHELELSIDEIDLLLGEKTELTNA